MSRNLVKRRASALKWAKANYVYIYKKKAEYRSKDPLRMRRWSIEHPERMQACRDAWYKANPARVLHNVRMRQAAKLRATPAWANEDKIAVFYAAAAARTSETGVIHEVDHMVPLRGRTVCGLHVEHNLAVIPQSDNRRKMHFRWPDMP